MEQTDFREILLVIKEVRVHDISGGLKNVTEYLKHAFAYKQNGFGFGFLPKIQAIKSKMV